MNAEQAPLAGDNTTRARIQRTVYEAGPVPGWETARAELHWHAAHHSDFFPRVQAQTPDRHGAGPCPCEPASTEDRVQAPKAPMRVEQTTRGDAR